MKKEKIGFFKMGKFPLVSESHITNKIKNINYFKPIVICSEINSAEDGKSYLDKLKNVEIFSFKPNINKNDENSCLKKNVLRTGLKEFLKKIAHTTGLVKFLKFTELQSPEIIVKISIAIFNLISEINIALKNKKSKMYFFLETIQKEKIMVVDGCYGWEIIPLHVLKRHTGIRVILSIRGKDLAIIKKYRCIRDIVKKDADFLLTRSEYMREELIEIGFDDTKVIVNHSGCDVDSFRKVKSKRDKKDNQTGKAKIINIVSIGRFVEKKGQIYLLEACKILKNQNVKFILTMIGDGPLRKKMMDFVELNKLSKEVHFIGNINNDSIHRYLENNDIFILPSIIAKNFDSEGIPVSIMEAMASGLICISTDCVGIPELIDDKKNGYLVKERNPENIAETIMEIRKKKTEELEKVRNAAIAKIRKEFNSRIQSGKFEKIARKLY